MLTQDGDAKLLDFGIAATIGDDPSRKAGTAAYMAPEQAAGASPSPHFDVFALAGVGIHLLTGLPPERSSDGGLRAAGHDPDWPRRSRCCGARHTRIHATGRTSWTWRGSWPRHASRLRVRNALRHRRGSVPLG